MRVLSLLAFAALVVTRACAGPSHPLDGLTAAEQWSIVEALKAAGRVDSTTRFLFTGLREPARPTCSPGDRGRRFSARRRCTC